MDRTCWVLFSSRVLLLSARLLLGDGGQGLTQMFFPAWVLVNICRDPSTRDGCRPISFVAWLVHSFILLEVRIVLHALIVCVHISPSQPILLRWWCSNMSTCSCLSMACNALLLYYLVASFAHCIPIPTFRISLDTTPTEYVTCLEIRTGQLEEKYT